MSVESNLSKHGKQADQGNKMFEVYYANGSYVYFGFTDGKLNIDNTVCIWNIGLTICQFVYAGDVFPV